jgi:hypothetical protein
VMHHFVNGGGVYLSTAPPSTFRTTAVGDWAFYPRTIILAARWTRKCRSEAAVLAMDAVQGLAIQRRGLVRC